MPKRSTVLLILFFIFAFCLTGSGVYAFGAGNIPSFAYLEGKAFRHGDIEDTLAELIKKTSPGLVSIISKGAKFSGLDVKRVYFGNWLRDYSQAVDIAGLKKLQLQTIINLCMALGFLAHGYATHEFEVTAERLGVYLPVEHIDNPKGYGEGEDARKYHPKLRGPVDPIELEVDPRTGMKNYIANENGHWDTSKRLVRQTLERCIHLGRQNRSTNQKQDLYEAYRLLGTALHTLEDFSAHSNFCEIALVSMGHSEVFTHVGDRVRIQAPNGKWVSPLITGTFGGNDFIHSLLGEATDHISSASVTDLTKEIDKARSVQTRSGSPGSRSLNDNLLDMFASLPGGEGMEMSRDMAGIERLRSGGPGGTAGMGGKRPEEMSPQELHAAIWQVLVFRDSVVKKISQTIEKIPGLGPLIEKISDSITVFVFITLEPFLKPILKTASTSLASASAEVINSQDQYQVFNDPHASDPTHSFLSKDHFNLILNEPAGHIAKIIVLNVVTLVVKAWDDTRMDVRQITEEILQCLFHPDFHNPQSKIQREMLQYMRDWITNVHDRQSTLRRLTKQAVKNHENIRASGDGGQPAQQGNFAFNQGQQVQASVMGYVQSLPGVAQAQSVFGGGGMGRREMDLGPGALAAGYPGAAAPTPGGMGGSVYGSGRSYPSSPPGGGNSSYGPPGGGYHPSYGAPHGGPTFPEQHTIDNVSSYPGGPPLSSSSYLGGPPSGYGGGGMMPNESGYLPPPGPGGYGMPEGYPAGPPGFIPDGGMGIQGGGMPMFPGEGSGYRPPPPGPPGGGGGYGGYGSGGGW